MTQTLDTILGNLHNDQNRKAFLEQIYIPGNIAVADRILALSPDSDILEKEIKYAAEHGPSERVVALGCKLTDYYLNINCDILLRDAVIKLENPEVADYAIKKLAKRRTVDSLNYAADICAAFGRELEGELLLEQVFRLEMAQSGEQYPSIPARTAVKIGKFEEAIDLFLRSGYHYFDKALKVAKEHAPNRVAKIATLIFDGYDPKDHHLPMLYLEGAKILGKQDQAEKALKKEANNLKVDSDPRCYLGLVQALVSLGLDKGARIVVERVECYELKRMKRESHYNGSNHRELAELFLALGDKTEAAKALQRKIDQELPRNNPSQFMSDIDRVYELTGDPSVLQYKFLVFERERQYDQAVNLARKLGKTDLAETYEIMQSMTANAQRK